MDLHLRGKGALIPAPPRALGAPAAEVLAEEGCDVVLVSRYGVPISKPVA